MPRKTEHVVHNPDGGWDVKPGGGQRASNHYDKKSDAFEKAREIAKNNERELIIHKKDGKIQKTRSYGNDPCPPKDTD